MPQRGLLGASGVAITIKGSKMEKQHHVDGGATHASLGPWSKPARLLATVLLSGAIAGPVVSAAVADSSTPAADAPEKAASIEAIVVTGSRIARRDYQSDSPIATIDESALSAAGQPTLDRAIGELPQFAAAQGMSEVGDVQGSTGFAGGQAYGDLRGLGPNRALVLMDGRRMISSNPNGSVDLNTIPMSMIENVEVITGGASATYGSDAIAGVLNFKLRQHFSGAEVSYQHGETTHGDGASSTRRQFRRGPRQYGIGHRVLRTKRGSRSRPAVFRAHTGTRAAARGHHPGRNVRHRADDRRGQ